MDPIRRYKGDPPPDLPPFPLTDLEASFWQQGLPHVAGIDEAGRGAWAGPVVAAAVMLPPNPTELPLALKGLRDSKKMTARQRELMFDLIAQVAIAIGVGRCDASAVDHDGVVGATRAAMWQAVQALDPAPQALVIDAVDLRQVTDLPQRAVPFADSLSLSVAAASVIAKVTRDRAMIAFDGQYPGYGFKQHKGYGTAAHRTALEDLGVCAIHRKSFEPVAHRYERQTQPQLLDDPADE